MRPLHLPAGLAPVMTVLMSCALLAACGSPPAPAASQPTPTAPTAPPAPISSAPTATTAPLAPTPDAPVARSGDESPPTATPAAEPSPTARLQSQAEGPPSEAGLVGTPRATLGPIPGETITPANACDPNHPFVPFGAASTGGFAAFRAPLPPTPLWNPPGPKRVGLQVGHWRLDEVPPELGRLQPGATGGGKQEWEVNLAIAQQSASRLEADGYQVDVLPAVVPVRYQANAFVAIHADGDTAGALSGFKIARPGFSSVPSYDDQLVADLYQAYAAATNLPRDDEHISLRMRYYYAFNSRRYCHAAAPGVPQAIIETGYLTSASDRRLLVGDPGVPARGIAQGIEAFLASLP